MDKVFQVAFILARDKKTGATDMKVLRSRISVEG